MAGLRVHTRKLGRERALGQAWADRGLVEVDSRLSGKARLNVLLHEIIHCIFPEMSEEEVNRVAEIQCNTLWRDRYRRIEK